MPPTLDEAVAVLVAESTDTDPEEQKKKAKTIAQRIYKDVKGVANILIARGGGRANAEKDATHQKALDDKQAEIDTLTEERDDLAGQIEASKGKAPEFEAKLAEQKKKYDAAIEKLKGDLTTEKESRRKDRVDGAVTRFKALLEKHVDPFHAKGLLAESRDRFRIAENDLGYEVLQPGEAEEVFAPGDGERPEELLAEAILKDVPEKYIIVGEARPGAPIGSGRSGVGRVATKEQIKQAKLRSGTYGGAPARRR